MKTYKKLLVGTVSLLVMGLLFVAAPKHAEAATGSATYNDLLNCNKTFKWQDYAHITCKLSNDKPIVFTDSNPDAQDTNNHYVFAPPAGVFCGPDPHYLFNVAQEGLVVQPNNNWQVLYFNEGYLASGVSGCQSFSDKTGMDPDVAPIKASASSLPNGRSAIVLAGTSEGAQVLPDVTSGKFAGYTDANGNFVGWDFVRWDSKYDPTGTTGPAGPQGPIGGGGAGGKVYLFAENIALNKLGSECTGAILAVTADQDGNSAGAREYTLGPSGTPLSNYSDLNNLPSAPNCYVQDYNFGSGDMSAPTQIYIDPQIQNMAKIHTGDVTQISNPNQVTGNNGSCESNLNSAFSWVICPALSLADQIIGGVYGQIENQLCFNINVGSSSTTGNVVCQGPPNTVIDGIQSAWTIFKDIASALLVIVMLVMVFSQAIGGGPFDAYAVRKTLPKLVIAVIFMQLSFVLLRWAIDLSNDAGSAIGSLIMAPFGGPQNMSLQNIVGHNVVVATGGSGVGNAAFQFFTIIAALTVGIWVIPALPLLALYVIAGVFIAFFVLIIRKLLIIMLVMLAPLALIAWVLPGTDNYWKLWRTNFTKLLAMFPLIMAMLASGRVLAYITSQAGNSASIFNPRLAVAHLGPLPVPYFASVNGFADLAIVVGAFFAPYFLIPKTFSWGGSLMSAAGGAVNKLGTSATKKLEEPVKGYGDRFRGKMAKKYVPRGGPGSNILNRTATSLLGGRVIPSKYRSAILTQKGDKWNEEQDAIATALLKRKGETAMKEGYEAAVTTKDGSSFARYARDDDGNLLDKKGNIAYRKSGVDANGKDVYTDLAGKATTDFSKAHGKAVDTYDEADKRTLTGVAAMKQMWVDLADQSKNKNERKMAVRQLTATASWPEIQGSLSRGGNKVIDTQAWSDSITTSQEDYPRVLRSRVDAAPHVNDVAKKRLAAEKAKNPSRVWSRQQEKDYTSQQRVLYSIEDQMSNEDFQTQSEGYWEEVARVANLEDADGNLTKEAVDIKNALQKRLSAIRDIGGTAPQQLIGHLVGGSVEEKVDTALAGTDSTIRTYIPTSKPKQVPTVKTTPSGRTYEAENIEGGTRTATLTREDIKKMSEPEAVYWIGSRGGVGEISNQDLVAFYNNQQAEIEDGILKKPNEVQRIVREELQNRGLLNPERYSLPNDVPRSPGPTPAPPAGPASGGIAPDAEGTILIHPDIPPEEFREGGKYPPPDIPPSSGGS